MRMASIDGQTDSIVELSCRPSPSLAESIRFGCVSQAGGGGLNAPGGEDLEIRAVWRHSPTGQ